MKTKGEIKCEASTNGKRITLEPIRSLIAQWPFREVDSSLACGFRQEWVSGEDDKGETIFRLTVGAGVGSRWMTFEFKGKEYVADVEDLAKALIAAIENK